MAKGRKLKKVVLRASSRVDPRILFAQPLLKPIQMSTLSARFLSFLVLVTRRKKSEMFIRGYLRELYRTLVSQSVPES